MGKSWYTYMLRCADRTLYTGVAIDVQKRVAAHNAGKGAKYTTGRRPVRLVWHEKHRSQTTAMRREIEIKKWTRSKKEKFLERYGKL